MPDDEQPLGFLDQQLRHEIDGGLAASEAQSAINEEQEREIADTVEVHEEKTLDAQTGQQVGPSKKRISPLPSHFTSPHVRARKNAFLAAFRQCGTWRIAAAAAGIHRGTIRQWREWDPEFAQACKDAEEDAIDLIEARAHQLSTEGVLEPVYCQGIHVGDVRKFEPRLMQFMLQSRRREVYGQKVGLEHSGQIAGGDKLSDSETQDAVRNLLPTLAMLGQLGKPAALPAPGEAV